MRKYKKWKDEEVRSWAVEYTGGPHKTLPALERHLGVPHSTLWWCFTHRLQAICSELYIATQHQLFMNKHNK